MSKVVSQSNANQLTPQEYHGKYHNSDNRNDNNNA